MNCLFCQQPTVLEYSSQHAPAEEATSIISSNNCHSCHTNYFFAREKMISYCIYYQDCEAWFHLDNKHFNLRKLVPVGKKPNSITDWVYVLRLDFLPNITPQNIATKLPLYLPFL